MQTLDQLVGPELASLARTTTGSSPWQEPQPDIRTHAQRIWSNFARLGPWDLDACLDGSCAPDVFAGVCWLLSLYSDDTPDRLVERLLAVLQRCKDSPTNLWSCLTLLIRVHALSPGSPVIRGHDFFVAVFRDPLTSPACKGRLAWLLTRQPLDFDPDVRSLVELCEVCSQDSGPFWLLARIFRGTSQDLDISQLTKLLPCVARALRSPDKELVHAAASVMAGLTYNLHGDRVKACLDAGLPECLLSCSRFSLDAVFALTRICKHSKAAYERLLSKTNLAVILPKILALNGYHGLSLLLQLVGHEHSRERVWVWLEPCALACYRCVLGADLLTAPLKGSVCSVLQWLVASPKIAAHMVRNHVHKAVRFI